MTINKSTPFAIKDNKKGHQMTDVLFLYFYISFPILPASRDVIGGSVQWTVAVPIP